MHFSLLLLCQIAAAVTLKAPSLKPKPRDIVNIVHDAFRLVDYNGRFPGVAGQTTTVNRGVTAWLSGGSTHNFFGNLDNYGTIVCSQTDHLSLFPLAGGMSSYFTGNGPSEGNLNNYQGGFISLNDYGSASAPSYYWRLETMSNFGGLQFCGRGDTGGSTYYLSCRQSCTNNGLIDYGQYNKNQGGAFYWRNAVLGDNTFLTNDGSFRLTNVVFHNVQNIYGQGCWILNSGSVLYLEDGTGVAKNPSNGPSFPGQKIYFAETDSTIHMDAGAYSKAPSFGGQVFGFGKGHAIEFVETIKDFQYSANILQVNFATRSVLLDIGSGYDSAKLRKGKNTENYGSYNAIFYDDVCPNKDVPASCVATRRTCENPANTVGLPEPTATSSTQTSSTAKSSSTSTSSASTSSTSATLSTSTISSKTSSSSTSKSSVSASPTPNPGPCANGDPDEFFVASNGAVFGICRKTDYFGGDMSSSGPVPGTDGCSQLCSRTPGCIAGSYITGAGSCYLKSTRNPPTANDHVDSMFLISPGRPDSSSRTDCPPPSTVTVTVTARPTVGSSEPVTISFGH